MSTVRFYDVENRRLIDIPAAELAPGSVQVQLNGSDEVVWMEARHLNAPSKPRHQSLSPELNDAFGASWKTFRSRSHVLRATGGWVSV